MSRLTWNDCCCGPLAGITGDVVLVRAGWYHFMAMTLDGKINCFVGSGIVGAAGVTLGGVDGDSRRLATFNTDWARTDESLYFSDDFSPLTTFKMDGTRNLFSWRSSAGGNDGYESDVLIYVPSDSVRYAAAPVSDGQIQCFGPNSSRVVAWNCTEPERHNGLGDGGPLFDTSKGICLNSGCWYVRNNTPTYPSSSDNTYFLDNYWPHGYMEFNGSGCTAARSSKINGVTSERWKYLITKTYGIFGNTASVNFDTYAGLTMVEAYNPPAISAPVGHPLRVPTLPTTGSGEDERPLKVIDIECGAYHNVIRLEDNTIMCWGLNSMGQCNVPDSLKPGSATPHEKLDKIVSIHAGFSTTAVLFNDGTALCWGDPEVACDVNNWTDIRVSPIKRHNGQEGTCCVGPGSQGYPDQNSPQYPANKYDAPNYNANTDWFKYWRTGTPGYPHFDLGIEVNPIYPVNWSILDTSTYLADIIQTINNPPFFCPDVNILDPKVWCKECQGLTIGKDFAVGMRRTGQLVTTRKINAGNATYGSDGATRLYSRDCSIDGAMQFESGVVRPPDIGYNYEDTTFCSSCADSGSRECSPGCPPGLGNCRDFMVLNHDNIKCGTYDCPAYSKWVLPESWLENYTIVATYTPPECNDNASVFNVPEGIGCFSSDIGEEQYDPNWATSASIYYAGQQVRASTFVGGRYPSWNKASGIGVNYGWSTLVAAVDRYLPSSMDLANMPLICRKAELETNRCTIEMGNRHPCEKFCPSDSDFEWSTKMGSIGIPGLFRYPTHVASALTCIAGTDTVAWVSSAQLLSPTQTDQGTGRDWLTETSKKRCEKYHLNDTVGNNGTVTGGAKRLVPDPCSECALQGSNPTEHTVEVGKTTYGCIYGRSGDADNNVNPFRNNIKSNWCNTQRTIDQPSYMLPSRPWGPWNIQTNIGFAAPNVRDLLVCDRALNVSSAYVSYRPGAGTYTLDNTGSPLPWNNYFGPGMPNWFNGSCTTYDAQRPDKYRYLLGDGYRGGLYPHDLMWKQVIALGENANNGGDDVPNSDPLVEYYDCYESSKTCGCAHVSIKNIWTGNRSKYECSSSTKEAVDFGSVPRTGFNQTFTGYCISGQQGVTCSANTYDVIDRWCFNNPIISYATGRSFAVHVRACPWVRGLSGEFIWKSSCEESNAYFKSNGPQGWSNSTSQNTKSLKIWMSGILEDPCPPWPVDVNVNGITCGVYPAWVPVPSTNTTRRADKGTWTITDCTHGSISATWGYTLGCETSWPSGVTGCTLTDGCF
jgi:hypothetical protein